MDYWKKSQMAIRELGFSFLIFIYLIDLASSYPIHKTLPSELMQKSKIEDKGIYGSKIEGGSHHGGGHGGKSHGNGDSSPNTNGGTAVIPVIVAGAANNNRHQGHHSAANCNLNKIKFHTMILITLVPPLIQLLLVT